MDSICKEDEQDEKGPLSPALHSSRADSGAGLLAAGQGTDAPVPAHSVPLPGRFPPPAFPASKTKRSAEQLSSNMPKPKERHLFMLGFNLAPRLPEDWRTCHVALWPALCRLDP